MTQEEKAIRYDEALERAKKEWNDNLDNAYKNYRERLEIIFPELKESEDEKIRKELIEFVKSASGGFLDTAIQCKTFGKWAAWLEKQVSPQMVADAYLRGCNDTEKKLFENQSNNLVENGYTDNKDIIKYADNYSHAIWHKLMDNFKNIKDYHIGCNDVSDIVLNAIIDAYNWFEKQGKQENKINSYKITFEDVLALECAMKTVKITKGGNELYEMLILLYNKIHNAYLVEKQDEQTVWTDNDYDKVKSIEYLLHELDNHNFDDWFNSLIPPYKETVNSYCQEHCKGFQETGKCFADGDCEAKKEAESINKVEPKFHEGEWITNGDYTWKIVKVEPLDYMLQSQDGNIVYDTISYVDELFHSFTIQDAKDGDVLAYVTDEEDLWIMIYWSLYEPYEGHVHYHALLVNDNFSDKGTCCICINDLKPATKEQRDLLEKAMTDAGYTFDFDNKELKKIEDVSKNCKQQIMSEITDLVTDYIRQKTDWSEEDEEMIDNIMDYMKPMPIFFESTKGKSGKDYTKKFVKDATKWLKSLKQRYTWKPSDEQIKALEETCDEHWEVDGLDPLYTLWEQLKKLKGE